MCACVWVCGQGKLIQVCSCNVCLCGCACAQPIWSHERVCVFMHAWMKASFSSFFAIILSLGLKHQGSGTPPSRHFTPLCECVCGTCVLCPPVRVFVCRVAVRHVYAHSLRHPLFLPFSHLSSHVSQTLVTQNFITIPMCLCMWGENVKWLL